MKSCEVLWVSRVVSAALRHFPGECGDDPHFPLWFVAAAKVRSGLCPSFSGEKGSGMFALSDEVFGEMRWRLRIPDGVSPLDPEANIDAALGYIRWLFDHFAEAAATPDDALMMSLSCLDGGLLRALRALRGLRAPVRFSQFAAFVGDGDALAQVARIAALKLSLQLGVDVTL